MCTFTLSSKKKKSSCFPNFVSTGSVSHVSNFHYCATDFPRGGDCTSLDWLFTGLISSSEKRRGWTRSSSLKLCSLEHQPFTVIVLTRGLVNNVFNEWKYMYHEKKNGFHRQISLGRGEINVFNLDSQAFRPCSGLISNTKLQDIWYGTLSKHIELGDSCSASFVDSPLRVRIRLSDYQISYSIRFYDLLESRTMCPT